MTQPTLFIPHGAGPCFFMEPTARWPAGTWDKLAGYLRSIVVDLPERPRAILVISAHWEAPEFTVTAAERPPMLFDYYGFPQNTYHLDFPAPGLPSLAARVRELLGAAGIASAEEHERGFDHGVFIPLLLATPDADIPVVQLSLKDGLDPAEHLAAGKALAPLRDEGVLIIGSGYSWHNTMGFRPEYPQYGAQFDAWLRNDVTDPARRDEAVRGWEQAPHARDAHPREEHLAPMFVVAGAGAGDPGSVAYHDDGRVLPISGLAFGAAR